MAFSPKTECVSMIVPNRAYASTPRPALIGELRPNYCSGDTVVKNWSQGRAEVANLSTAGTLIPGIPKPRLVLGSAFEPVDAQNYAAGADGTATGDAEPAGADLHDLPGGSDSSSAAAAAAALHEGAWRVMHVLNPHGDSAVVLEAVRSWGNVLQEHAPNS